MKKSLVGLIGIGAFIIGGLLAQASALEGIELLEEKVDNIKDKINKRQTEALEA